MIDSLLVNQAPGEMRIALLDGERVVEISHHRAGSESLVGNLYLGRVTGMLAGANGAFVDLGEGPAGFLNAADARTDAHGVIDPIGRTVDEGAALLVQVSRDGLHHKGPRLTMRPNLVGRYLVFHPGQGAVEVSRRITRKAERQRLMRLVEGAAQAADGFTLRSAAAGADDDQILSDLARLRDAWGEALALRDKVSPPARLWTAPDPLERALMDHPGLGLVVMDRGETLARARRLMAGRDAVVFEHYRDPEPIFERFAVEQALEEAFEARVEMPSGGAVIFEETHALCAIDVDGGRASVSSLRVNLKAAEVIARQLRLRAIGGLIVIDFLRLSKRDQRRKVIEALTAALADDRDAVAPEGFSKLGLVEMRRRRGGPSLRDRLGDEVGEARKNPTTAALDIGRAAAREIDRAAPGKAILRVAPEVAAAFTPALLAALEHAAGRKIETLADPAYQRRDWRIDFS